MNNTRRALRYLLVALALVLLGACEYYYTDDLFQGFWQVVSIEDRSSGELMLLDGEAYYAFQRHMAQLSYVAPDKVIGYEPAHYLAYFTYDGDTLRMGSFKVYLEEHVLAPLSELKRFGIYRIGDVSFGVEATKHRMVLTSDETIVTLRKY